MPQLAWFSKNERDTYKLINNVRYAGIDGAAVGQEVEDAVLSLVADKEVITVDDKNIPRAHRHTHYHKRTQEAMAGWAEVIYQPWFLFNKLYCKCDLLVKNDHWTYDLREVKAKNSIRKKSKETPLLDDLVTDVSFQDYVLKQSLGMMYSGKVYIVHLNKEYLRQGDLDMMQLLIKEDVTDDLMEPGLIESIAQSIHTDMALTKEALDAKYLYKGQDHLSYFWTPAPKDSIRKIPRIWSKLWGLYDDGKRRITDLNELDIESLRNKKWEETGIMKYLKLWNQWETVINSEEIKKEFDSLKYPLFFYDYETISVPLPLFEQTHSRQQVVVQYSCHKIEADGTITHTEWLIENTETENLRVIDKLIHDLEWGKGTYVVRYDGFENKRNEELAKMYPQHAEALLKINEITYDLMKIFSTWKYFDRRFQWSSSIKKVLPVLTDISYDNLAIPNGSVAADALAKLAKGLIAENEVSTIRDHLLEYCKQDTGRGERKAETIENWGLIIENVI